MEKLPLYFSGNRMLSVMYHGVVKKDSSYFTSRHITSKQFEKHLQYFKANFNIVTTSEMFEMRKQGIAPARRTISISFDDGYLNNLTEALPLLEKYQIPATFFVLGMCINGGPTPIVWADALACFARAFPGQTIHLNGFAFNRLVDQEQKQHLFDLVKVLEPGKRDTFLQALIEKYDLITLLQRMPEEAWKLMDAKALVTLANSPYVTIGSHGTMHYNLANIPIEDAISDMQLSKDLIEDTIQSSIHQFAFPDGNYHKDVVHAAWQMGFDQQYVVNYNQSSDADDTRILNRHITSGTTTYSSNMIRLNRRFASTGH